MDYNVWIKELIDKIQDILVNDGQFNSDHYGFIVGDTIKFSPSQVAEILQKYSGELKSVECISKAIPIPLRRTEEMLSCPVCKRHITHKDCRKSSIQYCPKCGQHLDWNSVKSDTKPENSEQSFTISFNNTLFVR